MEIKIVKTKHQLAMVHIDKKKRQSYYQGLSKDFWSELASLKTISKCPVPVRYQKWACL